MSENKVQDDWGFSEADIPKSNFFKFEKVGDSIAGVLDDSPYTKEGTDGFPAQVIYPLATKDGDVVNVGIKKFKTDGVALNYVVQSLKKARKGDVIKFVYTKEIPATKKGYKPAKSITPYLKLTPEGNNVRDLESFGNA
jgi:hypothetical protein